MAYRPLTPKQQEAIANTLRGLSTGPAVEYNKEIARLEARIASLRAERDLYVSGLVDGVIALIESE